MKKYVLTLSIMVLFAIGFAASDESSRSTTSDNSSRSQDLYVGTYKGMDGAYAFTITINEDNTATLNYDGDVSYGSWRPYSDYEIAFTLDETKHIGFFRNVYDTIINIKDGWWYMYTNAAKSKNPDKRMAIQKM